MARMVATYLRAFGWLVLVLGLMVGLWFIVTAFQATAQTSARDVTTAVLLLIGLGTAVGGGIIWGVLMMLSFMLDALLDIRDRTEP
jgi:ABC-type nitrate/sulfonate/bicarbonate transport system permease component